MDSFTAWPQFEEDAIAAAQAVLMSGRAGFGEGLRGVTFERAWSERFGGRSFVVSSASVGLELALRALGAGPGRTVAVPDWFPVEYRAVLGRLGSDNVVGRVKRADGAVGTPLGLSTPLAPYSAALAFDYAGWPSDVEATRRIGVLDAPVIRVVGRGFALDAPGGDLPDAAVWSFGDDATLPTGGEGGMVVLYRDDLAADLESLLGESTALRRGLDFPVVQSFPYRPTEMQSAIGLAGLARVEEWVQARRELARFARDLLVSVPSVVVPAEGAAAPSYYRVHALLTRTVPGALPSPWRLANPEFEVGATYPPTVELPISPVVTREAIERAVEALASALG